MPSDDERFRGERAIREMEERDRLKRYNRECRRLAIGATVATVMLLAGVAFWVWRHRG